MRRTLALYFLLPLVFIGPLSLNAAAVDPQQAIRNSKILAELIASAHEVKADVEGREIRLTQLIAESVPTNFRTTVNLVNNCKPNDESSNSDDSICQLTLTFLGLRKNKTFFVRKAYRMTYRGGGNDKDGYAVARRMLSVEPL